MYINSLGMGGAVSFAQRNHGVGATNLNRYNYDTVMQKALEKRNAAIGSAAASDGDMIIAQPFYAQKNNTKQSVSTKDKSQMSMSEYRQWFRSEVAGIGAEAYARSPYISDTLVIKEDAFKKMKNEPEWEKEVLNKIREHCYGKEITGTKAIGYQVIGASPETCHEEGIPIKTNALSRSYVYPSLSADFSYAALSSLSPYAGTLYTANLLPAQNGYWNTMSVGQNGLSNYLAQGLSGSQSSLGILAKTAYGNVLGGGMAGSLLGNYLI